jgi:membrane protease YdiL (CAAX protease family)
VTQLTLLDHCLAVLLAVVLPIGGFLSMRTLRRRIDAGFSHTTRVRDYRNNMLVMWTVTAAAVAHWLLSGRAFSDLGIAWFDAEAGPLLLALLLAAGLVAINLYLYVRVLRSDAAAEGLLRQTRRFDFVLPRTRRELHWFYAVSVTAGVTEEILYRGFMITYLLAYLTLPAAVVVSSLVFASAHVYQGAGGTSRAFTIALVLAAIYLLSGSILLAALAHVLLDAISGRMIFLSYNRTPPTATPQEAC